MMKFPFPVICFFLTITEDTVYHLVPPPNINSDDSASTSSTRGWVVRLREGESGEPSMLHPLSSSFHIKRLPKSVSYRVAISLSPDWPAIMVVATGKLYHSKLGPDIEMCTMVDTSEQRHCIKNLVESLGEILLVERYPSRIKHCFVPVKFRVYKLNAVERKWVEMEGVPGLGEEDKASCLFLFRGLERKPTLFEHILLHEFIEGNMQSVMGREGFHFIYSRMKVKIQSMKLGLQTYKLIYNKGAGLNYIQRLLCAKFCIISRTSSSTSQALSTQKNNERELVQCFPIQSENLSSTMENLI
ncbi:unnamed protein product [Prunus armeniaca]